MESDWIKDVIKTSTPISTETHEEELANLLITACHFHIKQSGIGALEGRLILAAVFDLLVSAEYYKDVAHAGWVYCPEPLAKPSFLYPYTNICPRCVLGSNFIFHQANKPQSGSIGARTSKLLTVFLGQLFRIQGKKIEIRKGREPVDCIFLDKTSSPPTALFAEIKASPLITLPLTSKAQKLTTANSGKAKSIKKHQVHSNSNLYGSKLSIGLPTFNKKNWELSDHAIGSPKNQKDKNWAYRGIIKLIKSNPNFLVNYFKFWVSAFNAYGERSQKDIYWLTNGCGQPSPRPSFWPKISNGTNFESVSDSKTSVGMDRTDDIKKGIYQVLKLGAEGHPQDAYNFKVGIISNVHAERHFDEYLLALKDIIWTREETGKIKKAGDLNPETKLFNLFDGIIALSKTHARDEWIRRTFDF